MPKTLFLGGVAVALLGLVLLLLPGPGVPFLLFGAVLAIVGGSMLLGKRRRAASSHRRGPNHH